jgi:DnaJ family protein C protein 3
MESLNVAEGASKSAFSASEEKKWDQCIVQATKALEVGTNSAELRELRVDCATELGDVDAVYGDLR